MIGQANGWVDGWVDGCMGECVDELICAYVTYVSVGAGVSE